MVCTYYQLVICFILLFINNTTSIFQTLTTTDENKQINGARIRNLSPTTIPSDSSWDMFVNQDNDQWGLWIKTDSTWGFDSILPSSFSIELHGNTISSSSDLLISISNGIDTKYSTILIRLNGQTQNLIAPGCDNIYSPLQSFISGDVYLTMVDNPTPGNRLCRPAYINTSNNCSYTTFGPANKIIWPMTFTINNYPNQRYSTISFESNGYSSISCGFGESFIPNTGTNIWITALVNDNYEISKINLNYNLLPTTNPTTSIPTTLKPTINPTFVPSTHPTIFPTTINPTLSPTNYPTITPTIYPTITPTIYPTSINPTLSPTNYPTITPTIHPTIIPTIYPTLTPTIYPSITPTQQPVIATTNINPTLSPTIYPTMIRTIYPTFAQTKQPYTTAEPIIYTTAQSTMYTTDLPTIYPTISGTYNPSVLRSEYPTISVSVTGTKTSFLTDVSEIKSAVNTNPNTMSIVMVIVVSVGTTIMVMLCLFTCCICIWNYCIRNGNKHKKYSYRRETTTIEQTNDTGVTGPTLPLSPPPPVETNKTLIIRTKPPKPKLKMNLSLQSLSSSSHSEHSVELVNTNHMEILHREGNKTIPPIDDIDRLYGTHQQMDSIYTDTSVESLYDGKQISTRLIQVNNKKFSNDILDEQEEKDEWDESSSFDMDEQLIKNTVQKKNSDNYIQSKHQKTDTQKSFATMISISEMMDSNNRNTHDANISMDLNVYEYKENDYDENNQDDIDVLTPRLTENVAHQTKGYHAD